MWSRPGGQHCTGQAGPSGQRQEHRPDLPTRRPGCPGPRCLWARQGQHCCPPSHCTPPNPVPTYPWDSQPACGVLDTACRSALLPARLRLRAADSLTACGQNLTSRLQTPCCWAPGLLPSVKSGWSSLAPVPFTAPSVRAWPLGPCELVGWTVRLAAGHSLQLSLGTPRPSRGSCFHCFRGKGPISVMLISLKDAKLHLEAELSLPGVVGPGAWGGWPGTVGHLRPPSCSQSWSRWGDPHM